MPCRACRKGILVVHVGSGVPAESLGRAVFPLAVAVAVLQIALAGGGRIVVYNHLVGLPVALPRRKDVGPGVFEHRDEKGYHDGGCKQVFGGAKQVGALPLPAPFLVVEILAVAGIDGEVAVEEATLGDEGAGSIAHPRFSTIVYVSPDACNALGVIILGNGEPVYCHAVDRNAQAVARIGTGQQFAHLAVNLVYGFGGEVLCGKGIVGGNGNDSRRRVYMVACHACLLHGVAAFSLVQQEIVGQLTLVAFVQPGFLCSCNHPAANEHRQQQQ